MSLKAFHVVFIVAALALVAGLGTWSLRNGDAATGIGTLVFALGLGIYLARFMRRTRHLPFLCAVCLGDPSSLLAQSANSGVLLLLGVIMLVLVGFAALFLYWGRRSLRKGRELQLE